MKYYNDFVAFTRKKLGLDATASDAEIHQAALDELEPTTTNTPQNTENEMIAEQYNALMGKMNEMQTTLNTHTQAITTLQGDVVELAKAPNSSVGNTPKGVVSVQNYADAPSWASNPSNKNLVDKLNRQGVDFWEYTRECIRKQAEA